MRKLLLIIAVLLSSIGMFAQPRSEEQAKQIAKEFFGKKPQRVAPALSVVPQQRVSQQIRKKIASAQKAPTQHSSCYVINDEANNRFVIVSADERLYEILGYSDNGCFNAENAPEGLMEMLEGYDNQYSFVLAHDDSFSKNAPSIETGEAIEPLIKTKWAQGMPFNNDCPVNKRATDGSKCYSGCVATAMAQVMNYHQYPSVGIGSKAYFTSTQNYLEYMNFGSTTFNWDMLPNIYDDNATAEERAEVAKLMHACGVAVSMDYGESPDGQSGAFPYDIPYAMKTYFGYNPNITYKEKDYYTADEWNAIIMQELQAGRPVLYGGHGTGGHCFILDGSDADGLYHMCFGQESLPEIGLYGPFDGYYSLDAISLKDPVISLLLFLAGESVDEFGNYTNRQSMVYQIAPETVGLHEDVFYASSFSLYDYGTTKVGDKVSGYLYARNYSSVTSSTDTNAPKFDGEVGIGLFDSKFNFIQSLYSEPFNENSYERASISPKVTFAPDVFQDGEQYIVAPYAKSNSSETPTRIRKTYGKGWYLVDIQNGKVSLTENGTPHPNPIPTGTIYASALGADEKQVKDDNSKPTIWKLTLTKDGEDSSKYWFDNFDPAVSGSSNRVYGKADTEGTQILIPKGQILGDGLTIVSYGETDDIVVDVAAKDSTMKISQAWGTIEISTSGENATQKQVSFYSSTAFSFKPFESDDENDDSVVIVSKPFVNVNATGLLSISCSTEGADIYYTTNGQEPTTSSALYSSPVQLSGNCTVKAIAVKDGNQSETAEFVVDVFVVEKPVISANGTTITISCGTAGADIYYTLDESTPSAYKTKYIGAFDCSQSTVIMAIARKSGYKDSEVAKYIHVIPDTLNEKNVTITDLAAGQLPSKISSEDKLQIVSLTISGQLNGTDIKFIREMIIDGSLTDLNIQNASIVNGGDVYYSTIIKDYTTADNIIGDYMFYNCKGLISLLLPSDATKISSSAINGCDNLKQIKLPSACTTVEMYGIYSCKNLESVTVSSSTNSIHQSNMNFCPNLVQIEVEDGNDTYLSEDGILFSKDKTTLLKYPVGKSDKAYSIPRSVKTIGQYAFSHSSLQNVAIPESVITIETSAFDYCKNLAELVVPNSVTTIGMGAFSDCAYLTSVVISENLEKIESFTFSYCVNLQSVNIPRNVKEINSTAFNGCSSLKAFKVSDDNSWFTANEGVIYTKDMKKLVRCPMALYAEVYQIPDGVEEISDYAFNKCKNIQKFNLPKTVKTIGISAFGECSMKGISLPQTVSKIETMAFENCDYLESLIIPESVEEIPMMLVAYCDNLSYLSIPANVKSVRLSAFRNCKSLTMINCQIADIDSVEFADSYDGGVDAFVGIPDTCTWRILQGTVKRYKAQPWWVKTWSIIIEKGDEVGSVLWNDSATDEDVWHNLQGVRLSGKPATKGIYLHNGRKVLVK